MTSTFIRRAGLPTILPTRVRLQRLQTVSCAAILGMALAAGPLAALTTIVTAGPAAAQATAPQSGAPGTSSSGAAQSMPQGQSPAMDLSEEKLQSFAAASLQIEDLNEKWAPRAAAAESEEDQRDIRNTAMNKMTEAVEDEGLTVSEYNAIAGVVQADPQVAQRVMAYRQNMQ